MGAIRNWICTEQKRSTKRPDSAKSESHAILHPMVTSTRLEHWKAHQLFTLRRKITLVFVKCQPTQQLTLTPCPSDTRANDAAALPSLGARIWEPYTTREPTHATNMLKEYKTHMHLRSSANLSINCPDCACMCGNILKSTHTRKHAYNNARSHTQDTHTHTYTPTFSFSPSLSFSIPLSPSLPLPISLSLHHPLNTHNFPHNGPHCVQSMKEYISQKHNQTC